MSFLDNMIDKIKSDAAERKRKRAALKEIKQAAYEKQKIVTENEKWEEQKLKAEEAGKLKATTTPVERIRMKAKERKEKKLGTTSVDDEEIEDVEETGEYNEETGEYEVKEKPKKKEAKKKKSLLEAMGDNSASMLGSSKRKGGGLSLSSSKDGSEGLSLRSMRHKGSPFDMSGDRDSPFRK